MIDIEKVRGHLGNLWGQTSMSDVGSKCELEKALTELERLQKKEVAMKPIQVDPSPIAYYAYYCPNCDNFLRYSDNSSKHDYCSKCNQKLDWSDEK